MIDTKELRRLAQAASPGPDGVSLSWIKLLQDFQQGANPAAINELLDRLEAAESEAIEQARLNGIGAERELALMAKLEVVEKERDALRAELTDLRNSMTFRTSLIGRIEAEREDLHALIAAVKKQVNAEFRLRMKKEIECNALRAKIARMEQQGRLALCTMMDISSGAPRALTRAATRGGR